MKAKVFSLLSFFAFVLSSCGNPSVASEGGTSVPSESRADPPQLSDSENKSEPVDETAESDAEETDDHTEENKPIFASEEDKAAFDLLGNYYMSHSSINAKYVTFHVSDEGWERSEDYELFRKYFFGSWEKEEPQPWETPLVIDDSENSWFARNCHVHHFMDFYKVGEDVLVFRTGSAPGGTLYWLDKNEPDTLYWADGAPGGPPAGISTDEDGIPYVRVSHKNDTEPNEPENNYLSVYRLREMAKKHGVDYELLVYVELETIPWIGHDDKLYFYPMYLVSETGSKIEIKTQAGDIYSDAFDIRLILRNIDGEWTREVVLMQ